MTVCYVVALTAYPVLLYLELINHQYQAHLNDVLVHEIDMRRAFTADPWCQNGGGALIEAIMLCFALHARIEGVTTGKGRQHGMRGAERIESGWRLEDTRSSNSAKMRSILRTRAGEQEQELWCQLNPFTPAL